MEVVQPIRCKKQINAIKKILKATSLRDHCLFVLGINSALRISDLLKFKIEDVIEKNGKVKESISLRETKTDKLKNFALSKNAKLAINLYLESRKYKLKEPLFLSRKGGAITRVQAYRIINAAAKEIGLKEKIGTHTLRKTFGFHAYQENVDIVLLQKLFNHSCPSVTLAYIGITQKKIDDVYLNLNL